MLNTSLFLTFIDDYNPLYKKVCWVLQSPVRNDKKAKLQAKNKIILKRNLCEHQTEQV